MRGLIRRLLLDGYNAREVSVLAGVNHRRVYRIARRIGISVPHGMGGSARRVSVALPASSMPLARDLAAAAGVSLGEFLARAFLVEMEDGGKSLVRKMGRLARRPRSYTRGGRS